MSDEQKQAVGQSDNSVLLECADWHRNAAEANKMNAARTAENLSKLRDPESRGIFEEVLKMYEHEQQQHTRWAEFLSAL